ncbi:hypothetical protein FHR81_001420 [Actinoalloteichus hoggarensis]|uniref:Uncharacterized protein n=1 Tax=Actinoalloteichus hoggarensis TaxID=1470176 RepID=A0A221W071_9PSEU|nr:hypothetical protein AHOG_07545 [Actinoalloteichus hoggarensis]MBB5920390.1 hypothetical protein [Actinoalloteichus hoggarensis]
MCHVGDAEYVRRLGGRRSSEPTPVEGASGRAGIPIGRAPGDFA